MRRALFFVFALLAAIGFGIAIAAEPTFPALTGRVVDDAQVLDLRTRSEIEGKLADFETKTGDQLVVVTLKSLQGYDIADYGYRLGRAWGIGQKGSDNGVLLIVAPNERQVRIETGYGLEGTLTDAISRLIIDNAILPRFRAGDIPGGIERGVDDIIQVLSGDAEDFQRRAGEQQPVDAEEIAQLVWILLILGIWLFFALRAQRRDARRRRVPWIVPVPTGPPSGRWPGGSGGGFRGGGGSFGGGGASGRW
jgi:uncharacterized protein